jgi:hypothetical protein
MSVTNFKVNMAVAFVLLTLVSNTSGQQQNPLTQPKNSIGTVAIQQPKEINVLTQPSPAVVPDVFKEGEISQHVETLEYRIGKLEDDMKSVLGSVGFAKGAFYIVSGILVVGGLILKRW